MTTNRKKNTNAGAALGEFDPAAIAASINGLVDTLKSGKAHTLRTTTIKLPEPLPVRSAAEVRALRDRLSLSQGVFAALLNVPLVTVSSWENGQRKPSGAALKLLDIAERHPELFVDVFDHGTTPRIRSTDELAASFHQPPAPGRVPAAKAKGSPPRAKTMAATMRARYARPAAKAKRS